MKSIGLFLLLAFLSCTPKSERGKIINLENDDFVPFKIHSNEESFATLLSLDRQGQIRSKNKIRGRVSKDGHAIYLDGSLFILRSKNGDVRHVNDKENAATIKEGLVTFTQRKSSMVPKLLVGEGGEVSLVASTSKNSRVFAQVEPFDIQQRDLIAFVIFYDAYISQ